MFLDWAASDKKEWTRAQKLCLGQKTITQPGPLLQTRKGTQERESDSDRRRLQQEAQDLCLWLWKPEPEATSSTSIHTLRC